MLYMGGYNRKVFDFFGKRTDNLTTHLFWCHIVAQQSHKIIGHITILLRHSYYYIISIF